jgi:glycerol-3-phosphate acyltransferase PlsX
MMMPSREGAVVVLDSGAVVDCRPEHLRDFARMGSVYAQCLLHRDRPRVGLLNIGAEQSKGNALTKTTEALLAEEPINFIGNVEGHQVALGDVDVVVCDGFVGNVILKATEGYAELFWGMLKDRLAGGLRGRIGSWLLGSALRGIAEKLDYASYGGALLVGVNGICVIGHGRSSPIAVANAIRVAHELALEGVLEQLRSSFQEQGERGAEAAAAGGLDARGKHEH